MNTLNNKTIRSVANIMALVALLVLAACAPQRHDGHKSGAAVAGSADTAEADASKIMQQKLDMVEVAKQSDEFDARKWLESDRGFHANPLGVISKYDHIIKKMSRRFGFDWRLVAAQAYVESNFRNSAKSHVGAVGLMQIMPSTAQYLGVDPSQLIKPEVNVALGVRYNQRLYSLWKRQLEKNPHRLAFALASYNAGRGRVLHSYRKNMGEDSLALWPHVYPDLPEETELYVHKIFLKYDFYKKHVLP